MILSFKFNNLLGSAYKSGNITFSPNKNLLFSPLGNKISVIDLESNQSSTLNLQGRSDIEHIVISPDSKILIIVDNDGYAQVVNLISKNVISHFNFKEPLKSIKFSPDGFFIAACTSLALKIYNAPGVQKSIEPFQLHRQYKNIHTDEITCMDWSPDSRFILTGSQDLTVKIKNIHNLKNYVPFSFTGHKSKIVKAFFSNDMKFCYTLTKDGYIFVWKWVTDYLTDEYKNYKSFQNFKKGRKIKLDNEQEQSVNEDEISDDDQTNYSDFEKQVNKGRFILSTKFQFSQSNQKIQCCDYYPALSLLIIGLKNGTFGLYTLNSIVEQSEKLEKTEILQNLQSFSVGGGKISFNGTGAWIAFGMKEQGQLVVWEWRSQTYIFNQQGLVYNVDCVDFSQNGNIIALGGSDGKIRLFDSKSNFCFQTFSDHNNKITDLKFSSKLNTLISCSLDGTIRAYDTLRYRNFRTMRADMEVQFNCLAIDPSGELVSAGGFDPYNIYQFNLQTGHLIEVISGHSGPITCLNYSPFENTLISTSWDKSLRIHSVFERKTQTEILTHNSEITSLAVRQDGKQVATSTFKGEIYLWNIELAQVEGLIDCQRDIQGGRLEDQKIAQKNAKITKYYKSISYSSDGEYIIAGGNSKFVNLYDIKTRLLVKKFQLTNNRSLDGILSKLNSKGIKDGKILAQIDESDASDYEDRKDQVLPGAKKVELTKRNKKIKVEVRSIKFSPNGKYWGAASPEGLYLYSLDDLQLFTPFELDEDINSQMVLKEFNEKKYYNALIMSLQINDQNIMSQIFLNIPIEQIEIISKNLPKQFILPLLNLISHLFENSLQIEFILVWVQKILLNFSNYFQSFNQNQTSIFKSLLTSIFARYSHVSKVTIENQYTLEYLIDNLQMQQNLIQ